MSASTIVRYGPGSRRERSRTRIPRNASARGEIDGEVGGDATMAASCRDSIARSLGACDLEQLLQLHREHRIARDAELALEVELHAGVGIAEHGLEVVVCDLDRALRLATVAARARGWIAGGVDRPFAAALAGDLEAIDR